MIDISLQPIDMISYGKDSQNINHYTVHCIVSSIINLEILVNATILDNEQ